MSLLDDIKQKIADAILPTQKRALLPYDRMASQRNIGSVSAGNELEASLRGTVFACLQHRANALIGVQFNTYKEQNFDRSEVGADHWAARLLANPNPYFTRSQVISYIENWLSINGNAFIWTPTNGYHVPLQMWVLNPTRVRIIKGSEKFVDGYIYQSAQDGNIAIPEKEMIHLARIHPAARPEEIVGMNMLGVGLVSAALEYANIDRETSNYLSRLFRNNAIPPLILENPDVVDQETWERLKAGWNESLPDFKLRGLLSGGMRLNVPPKGELTIGYDAVTNDTRSQIAQVFGVPPGMLTGEFQNRATAQVQWEIFRQNTIDPEALYIAEELTRHFKRFEDDVLIETEPYVFNDVDADIKREEFQLRWGIKTINEARNERGMDDVLGGDVPLITSGLVPLSATAEIKLTDLFGSNNEKPKVDKPSARNLPANASQTPGVQRLFPYNTNESRAEFWRAYDGLTTSNAIAMESVVKQGMAEMETAMLERIDSDQYNMFGITPTEQTITNIERKCNDAVRKVAEQVAKDLEGNAIPLDGSYGETLQSFAKENAQKIAQSFNVVQDEVTAVLQANAQKDKTELLQIITARFKNIYTESRLRAIANTVSASVTSGSQMYTYRKLGYSYIWLTEQDNRVRPSHQIMEGKEVSAAGTFLVPDVKITKNADGTTTEQIIGYNETERPLGDGLPASGAVNCRCQLFPVKR